MAVIIRSGAFKVMCQHIELKKNTWYYRRRIPTFAQALYGKGSTAKRPSQLYFSLKTDFHRVSSLQGGRRRDTQARCSVEIVAGSTGGDKFLSVLGTP